VINGRKSGKFGEKKLYDKCCPKDQIHLRIELKPSADLVASNNEGMEN